MTAEKIKDPRFLKVWAFLSVTTIVIGLLLLTNQNQCDLFTLMILIIGTVGGYATILTVIDERIYPFSNQVPAELDGNQLEKSITIETKVEEDKFWSIHKLNDVSSGVAKRYRAVVWIDRHYSKETIRKLIPEVIEDVKRREYYRNARFERRWKNKPAQVIWLFFASNTEDVKMVNWICRVSWIDSNLPKSFRPTRLSKNSEIENEIEIVWNKEYNIRRKSYSMFLGSKEEVLNKCNSIKEKVVPLITGGILIFEEYKTGSITESQMLQRIREIEPLIRKLYLESSHIPIAPDDIFDYVEECHSLFAYADNFFLYCSEKVRKPWDTGSRDWLMSDMVKKIKETLTAISFEEKKLEQ
ncbi:MAG: hypothetical protein ACFE9L_18300 [Candidatus Hodarchaeota archaeon]